MNLMQFFGGAEKIFLELNDNMKKVCQALNKNDRQRVCFTGFSIGMMMPRSHVVFAVWIFLDVSYWMFETMRHRAPLTV